MFNSQRAQNKGLPLSREAITAAETVPYLSSQDNFVLCIFNRYTKMKTATNIYIFNLALADALVTTTMPFQSTDYLLNTWPFGEVVCKVFISIDYYNMFTSIFTLTMMSVDRYVAVCHPVKALDFRTPLKAKMINVCIWILSSAAGIPAFVLGGTQTNSGEEVFPRCLTKSLRVSVHFLCIANTLQACTNKMLITEIYSIYQIHPSLKSFSLATNWAHPSWI